MPNAECQMPNGKCHCSSRFNAASALMPLNRTRLSRDFSPETMVMWRRGSCRMSDRKAMRASLAALSTGGAARRTRTAVPRMPSTSVRGDRGITRISSVSARGFVLFDTGLGRTGGGCLLGLPRAVEQDLVLGSALVLVADELERPVERLDGRLDRSLGVTAPQPQLVDLVIHLFEPGLGLLQKEVGPALRLADDEPRLVLRAVPHPVRHLLRRQQGVAKRHLALAVLREQRLQAHHVAPEAIDLPHGVLVVVGRFGQERHHLGAVVAAHRGLEPLLAHVHRGDAHDALRRLRNRRIVDVRRCRGAIEHQVLTVRLPNIAVPTRTSVAPSWMATSKSWLIPIDSSWSRDPSMPLLTSRSRISRRCRKYGRARSGSSNHGGSSIRPFRRAARQSSAACAMAGTSGSGAPNFVASPARSTWMNTSGVAPSSAAAVSTRRSRSIESMEWIAAKAGAAFLALFD